MDAANVSRSGVTEAGVTPRFPVTHAASKGGVAPASSEFGRVFPNLLFTVYLLPFRKVRFTEEVKRKKIDGAAPG